jgi:hypothetical protein
MSDYQTVDAPIVDSRGDQATAIDLVKSGTLWLKSRSTGFWAKSLLGVSALVAVGAVFYVINDSPTPDKAGAKFDKSLYMSQTSPAQLAGITPDTPPMELVQRLRSGVSEYDTLVSQETSKLWQDAFINEAHRLRNYAQIEAQSGQFIVASPFPAIDLSKCPAQLGDVTRCVLFRMQLEGLNALWEGSKVQDINLMQRGYARYKGAEIALNPPGTVAIDSDRLTSALVKKVQANYQIQKAVAPASSNPSLQLKTVPGEVITPDTGRNAP